MKYTAPPDFQTTMGQWKKMDMKTLLVLGFLEGCQVCERYRSRAALFLDLDECRQGKWPCLRPDFQILMDSRRRNVATSMVGLRNGHICKHLTKDVNPRDIAGERRRRRRRICLFVACLMSQQHACVSQGRISTDNFTCCHTEIEVADPTFYLTQSQYTDTGLTSPSAYPIMPGVWQGSLWSANV